MGTLKLVQSNRLEILADMLAETIKGSPLSDPFAGEVIIVQSLGMAHWLSLSLAARLGVWANCRYPFPNAFVGELFEKVVPSGGQERVYNTERAAWELTRFLKEHAALPRYAALADYLAENRLLKRYEIGVRIADTFDQYTLYRPDMMSRWDAGDISDDETLWQSALWRECIMPAGITHRAHTKKRFFDKVHDCAQLLPKRAAMFGISSLPPFHLEVLQKFAEHADFTVYLLNPCGEFWSDIASPQTGGPRSIPRTAACEKSCGD